LAVRLVYLFAAKHPMSVVGDAYYYHAGANLLADGKGYIDPYAYAQHQDLPGAAHPPLFLTYLALAGVVGARSVLSHQIWTVLLGTATIVAVAYAARQVAGRRAGLIAATVAALSPVFWVNDALLLSEPAVMFMSAIVILLAYRFWAAPSVPRALWLGGSIGLIALARSELALLAVLLVVPLVLMLRSQPWRRRLVMLVAAGGATLVVLGPWVGYNMARFTHPETLSSQFEATLANANCDETYRGPSKGWYWYPCIAAIQTPPGDDSVRGKVYGKVAGDYIRAHEGELTGVAFARVGRTFGFYQPFRQTRLDVIEGRPREVSLAALWCWWASALIGVAGAVVLRRRRVPIWPLLAFVVNVAVAVAVTFGQPRYRAPADVAVTVLAAVALAALLRRRGGAARPAGHLDGAEELAAVTASDRGASDRGDTVRAPV
jgi:4-amino-4-deoxy-L-arabinose transferase-like glycosyltransferase